MSPYQRPLADLLAHFSDVTGFRIGGAHKRSHAGTTHHIDRDACKHVFNDTLD